MVQMLEAEDLHLTDSNNTDAGTSQPSSAESERNIDPQVELNQINNNPAAPSQALVKPSSSILSIEENKSVSMINHISERVTDALKASSPSLWLSINNVCTNAIIDEGSELVVMDFEFAKKAKVAIEKS